MYIVKCNNCNALMQIELMETNLGGTKVGYFICPDCKAVYIGYIDSPAFSALVNKRREIIEQMASKGNSKKEYDRLYRKLLKTDKKMDKQQRTLKEQAKKEIEILIEQGKVGR